jgi:hypothetical protein
MKDHRSPTAAASFDSTQNRRKIPAVRGRYRLKMILGDMSRVAICQQRELSEYYGDEGTTASAVEPQPCVGSTDCEAEMEPESSEESTIRRSSILVGDVMRTGVSLANKAMVHTSLL